MKIYGSMLCPDCVQCRQELDAKGVSYEYLDFSDNLKNLKEFTKSGLVVPARVDVAQSEAFLDGQKPQNARVFLEVIETSKPTQTTIDYRQILDTLKTKAEYILN